MNAWCLIFGLFKAEAFLFISMNLANPISTCAVLIGLFDLGQ